MLFEGVYLYLMVVKVFNTEIRIRAFYSVAWGMSWKFLSFYQFLILFLSAMDI